MTTTLKINYQVMNKSQKNSYEKYIPDFEKLIAGATCEEEVAYIRKIQDRFNMYLSKTGCEKMAGFAFNMVYITRQTCGHFEIFQTPQNDYYSLEENLKQAEEHANNSKCSHCICGR